MLVIHQDEERRDDEREGDGGQRHRKNSQVERVNPHQNQQRAREDEKGVSHTEAGVGFRRLVLAPIPTEHLCRKISLAQTDLERRPETRYPERGSEEDETPVAE